VLLALPAPALAGRVIATGHAPDVRCATEAKQCPLLGTLVGYVRETAPRPNAPVLLLDRRDGPLAKVFASSSGVTVVDPASRRFRGLPLRTGRYSAIVLASSTAAGGSIGAARARAVSRRRGAVARFLNAGGGVIALAGSASRLYYSLLPLPRAGAAAPGPFTVTPYGERIGLRSEDLNCCAVHNTFATPAVGEMAVAARNDARAGDTLIADGRVRDGRLIADRTIPAEAGESIVVEPVSGRVLGHPPDEPGRFRPIVGAANLVMGWTLDVKRGRVRLTTAANNRGRQQSVQVYEGVFQILQEAGDAPVTDLALRGGRFDSLCDEASAGRARAAQTSKRVVRQLWGKGKGRFRTVGRFASAAVRGTEWLTQDRCDGTLVTVLEGIVDVFDRLLNRTVLVRAGRSYFARGG